MIGAGYVGLVSGACFADFGHDVCCVDLDQGKIDRLQAGVMPIFEPGLAELVTNNARAGRLTFTTDLAAGVADAEAVFIAVGTPSRRGDGHADLSYVFAAARDIARACTGTTVDRHQVDRPRRHRRRRRAGPPRSQPGRDLRRRLQPRIPARGRRDPRLQVPRPDRRRHRRPPRPRGPDRDLPPAVHQLVAAAVHRAAHRRADQICGERLPRDQDHLHQRDRRPVRGGRRERPGRRPRHRARQPHRRRSSSTPDRAMAGRASPRTRWR